MNELPNENDFRMIRTGYHYTSKSHWEQIQADGQMTAYEIHHDEVQEHVKEGVWMWIRKPEGISHMGNIIYQAATKGATEVVLLAPGDGSETCLSGEVGGDAAPLE